MKPDTIFSLGAICLEANLFGHVILIVSGDKFNCSDSITLEALKTNVFLLFATKWQS
jgi:hypothetical protein